MADDKDNQPSTVIAEPVVILDWLDETEEGEDTVGEGRVADESEVSYDRLYSFLLENEDIIIVVDEADVEDLRRGLSISKYVNNEALKKAKAPVNTRQIDYKIVERLPDTDPQQVKLQIWLKAKKSVYLHRLIISSEGL